MFRECQSLRLLPLGHKSSDLTQEIKVRTFNLLCKEFEAGHRPGKTELMKKEGIGWFIKLEELMHIGKSWNDEERTQIMVDRYVGSREKHRKYLSDCCPGMPHQKTGVRQDEM